MPIPAKDVDLKKRSAKEIIYEQVCDWIIKGQLKSGEKIVDSELASYFNVSRTPVREAIQMLERDKLVRIVPSKATLVAELDPVDLGKSYLLLAELQAFAAELACSKMTDEYEQRLHNCIRDFAAAFEANDVDEEVAQDNLFHSIILDISENEYLIEFSHTLLLHIQRIKYHYFHHQDVSKESAKHHEDIFNAFLVGNAGKAKDLMREHWHYAMSRSLAEVMEHVEEA